MIMQRVLTSQCEAQITSKLSVVDETLKKLVKHSSEIVDQKLQDLEQHWKERFVQIKA